MANRQLREDLHYYASKTLIGSDEAPQVEFDGFNGVTPEMIRWLEELGGNNYELTSMTLVTFRHKRDAMLFKLTFC